MIDVRDLAAWVIDAAARHLCGTFNAVGETVPLPTHLEVARDVAGHSGPLVTVDQEWLLAHKIAPWMGDRSLPRWLPLPEYAGFSSRSSSAARAAGLVTRSLEESLADALAWEMANGSGRPRRAGLSGDERALLQELAD